MSRSFVRRTITRAGLSTALIVGLIAAGGIAPAFAGAEGRVLTKAAAGFVLASAPIVEGPLPVVTPEYEISLTPRFGQNDFTGGDGFVLDLRIVNPTDTDLRIGFAVDLAVQGNLDRLWLPEAWGLTAADEQAQFLVDFFAAPIAPGATFELTIPDWPGKTYGFYLLADVAGPADPGQLVGYSTTSGGFVPMVLNLSDPDFARIDLGREATVAGAGANPELFRGVTATVTASGLTPGENLELWLAPDLDYFIFYFLGATLPANAINVGAGTVGPGGVLSTTFEIPANAPLGNYQLIVGNPANRYWPAGSYTSFTVSLPSVTNAATTPLGIAVPVSVPLGATLVDLIFPSVTGVGQTTVASSTTGPVNDSSFVLASNPYVYYHIDSTATFGGLVEVCITYNPLTLTGGIPWLYHQKQVGPNSYSWQNITTSRVSGKVCGLTNSFSPFTLGYKTEVVLTNKDQCKSGGWATSTVPVFRNQGSCVSHFAKVSNAPKKR